MPEPNSDLIRTSKTAFVESIYSEGNQDEWYTPLYGVEPILKYIPQGAVVWCPFDKDYSYFNILIGRQNEVITSHIDDGKDFLKYSCQPKKWDVMISNPPYTDKKMFFETALLYGKPFAFLMAVTWLNDAMPFNLWMKYRQQLQLLFFNRRIEYVKEGEIEGDRCPFASAYFCNRFLPRDLIVEELVVPQKGRNDKRAGTRFDVV